MTITASDRESADDTLRRWFAMAGETQIDLGPADLADDGWVTYARCGQWHDDAPDPEIFFPQRADSGDTYKARQYCIECPVRRYCDKRATALRIPGVWAGIYRLETGKSAALCESPGCLNYRADSHELCGAHGAAVQRRHRQEYADANRERHREQARQRRARIRAARRAGGGKEAMAV
jgi:Transcription factor WhiB